MSILTKILTLPVMGPISGVTWVAEKMSEHAEHEIYDEAAVRGKLMELELRLDLEEISEADYLETEEFLLSRLKDIRKYKAARAQQ
jgi:hypothetical protein